MNEMTYTEAMQQLEQIVGQLQRPDCDVDKLCELTARSVELLSFCKARLTQTDAELAKVLEQCQS